MRTSYRPRGTGLFGLSTLLSLAVASAQAAPALPTPPTNTPPTTPPTNPPAPATINPNTPSKNKAPRLLSNLTLDYANSTQNSNEVLNAKISVSLKDASLLSALDVLMNASDKTCRIECRQLYPVRLPLNVKDVPLAGVLDALAKLSGGRLYVLPNKLILAPEAALTDDEKKHAKLYGVLLTAVTLSNTPQVKALLKPDAKGTTILDVVNTKLSWRIENIPLGFLAMGGLEGKSFPMLMIGSVNKDDWSDRSLKITLNNVSLGDLMASSAHLVGLELYLTPNKFILCSPDSFRSGNSPETQNAVPAFTTSSTSIIFSDPSAKGS